MLRKSLIGLAVLVTALLAVVLWHFLFPAAAILDDYRDYGPSPELVPPEKALVPTVRPAKAVGWLAGYLRHIQTGYLYTYAFAMIIGLTMLLGWLIWVG